MPSTTKATIEDLAGEFQATLVDPRAPWVSTFQTWAEARGLGAELARSVKINVLRQRAFGAAERFQPRPRRRRC